MGLGQGRADPGACRDRDELPSKRRSLLRRRSDLEANFFATLILHDKMLAIYLHDFPRHQAAFLLCILFGMRGILPGGYVAGKSICFVFRKASTKESAFPGSNNSPQIPGPVIRRNEAIFVSIGIQPHDIASRTEIPLPS